MQVFYEIAMLIDNTDFQIASFTGIIFNDTLCHWLVTQTYIKVAFETN